MTKKLIVAMLRKRKRRKRKKKRKRKRKKKKKKMIKRKKRKTTRKKRKKRPLLKWTAHPFTNKWARHLSMPSNKINGIHISKWLNMETL